MAAGVGGKDRAAKTLQQFEADLQAQGLLGQWQLDAMLSACNDGPKPAGALHIWRWPDVQRVLQEACEVIEDSNTARRNISFRNPGLKAFGATQTLAAGYQIAKPGELAWAHRHTLGAVRLAIEGGPQVYTVVNGEALTMESNDLILTPNGNWHDHHNDSDAHAIWLDVLDAPLVYGLNQTFYQEYGPAAQARRTERAQFLSERVGILRPAADRRGVHNFPFRYPWKTAAAALEAFMKEPGSPYDGTLIEYVNPATGGPALPTMACWLQGLQPAFGTRMRRRTSSAVCHVIEGEGTTVAGDQEIDWSTRDLFVIPNWAPHRHLNRSKTSRAVLFVVTDEPALSALGLYREDPDESLRARPMPAIPARAG